jgi:hypothetical protein
VVTVDKLQQITTLLRVVYTDEGVNTWLRSRNRHLDMRRPMDLISEGQTDRVLAEATALARFCA